MITTYRSSEAAAQSFVFAIYEINENLIEFPRSIDAVRALREVFAMQHSSTTQ